MDKLTINSLCLFLVLLCMYCDCKHRSSDGCSVQLNGGLPKKEAILLQLKSGNMQLFHTGGPTIELKPDEQLVLACSGAKKYLTSFKNSSSVAYGNCISGENLKFGTQSFAMSNFSCDNTITGDIRSTKEPCGNGTGTWNNIGFDVRDSQVGFVQLYRVCYDQVTASVVYAEHILPGTSVADNEKESYRPAFKSTGTSAQVSPAKAYTKESEKAIFATLLGSQVEADKYFQGANDYLARGHMAPDADFTFAIWQYATYFYVNVCPQWQAVNAGNWLRVENLARKIGSNRGEDLTIYSGVHEILTLPDVNGNEVKMYLSEGGNIQVPKWIWKIVFSPKTYEGIAFVTLNNPFAFKVTDKEMLCKSVCLEAGFGDSNFESYDRGYTYCCTIQDLASVVKTIPQLEVKKLTIARKFKKFWKRH